MSEATPAEMARAYGCRLVSDVESLGLDPGLVGDLPVEWVRRHLVIPVLLDSVPCLLVSDPSDVESQHHVAVVIGRSLEPVVAPEAVVRECIQSCYFSRGAEPFEEEQVAAEEGGMVSAVADLLEDGEGSPVTQFVNRVLREALRQRASDIHFEPQEERLRVRYRVDGMLYEQASPPRRMTESLVSRLKVMGHMDIAERRLPQDGMARVRVGNREFDVRMSTMPVADGERVVLRILDRESALLPMEALGMRPAQRKLFDRMLHESSGIVAVCGPTGSGKTTTLYAALGALDSMRRNILTIEDPIEYRLPNIGQMQVKPKIGLTFSQGLRHILRQDPDIILVGETRDRETAEISIRAALTGHLVFTTLHTNDAPGALARLVDMGVEPYLLSACLRGVLSQRLVRTLCPHCRERWAAGEELVAAYGEWVRPLVGAELYRPVGCEACIEGYRGRTGVFEMMEMGRELRELVRGSAFSVDDVHAVAASGGMVPLLEDALSRVLEGTTTLDEIEVAVSR
jgi:general secretion pathway protein E